MKSLTSLLSGFTFGFAALFLWKSNMRGLFAAASSITQASGEMKMALVVRIDLKMGKGKAAAQCAHAAVSCYKRALYDADKYLQHWEKEGQPKVILATTEEQGLLTLARDAQNKGLIAVVIHDAGHTQIARGSATVVGIGPGPQDIVNSVVGKKQYLTSFQSMVLQETVDIINLTAIASSVAAGAAVALLLQGRFRWLFAGAQLVFGTGIRDMKMVLIVRSDLEMGKNKAAALCSHAALNCYKRAVSDIPDITKKWERSGQTKVVLKAPGQEEIMTLAETAQSEGLVAVIVYDDTPKQINAPSVLGIGPGPTKLVDKVAGHLKLY